jgi:stage III sporulation protein AD
MDVFSLMLRACGVGVLATICIVVVGQMSGGYATALRVGAALLVFGIFTVLLENTVSHLRDLFFSYGEAEVAAEAFETMLKALGIALTSRFCSDICRDCGEGTIAGAVESVGRIAIFSMTVPTMLKMLEAAKNMLEMIE